MFAPSAARRASPGGVVGWPEGRQRVERLEKDDSRENGIVKIGTSSFLLLWKQKYGVWWFSSSKG